MDYKNKYNDALKKLQEALAPKNGCEISGLTRGCIEEIFPELKESDDERIRKELIRYFKEMNFVTQEGAEKVTRWIAWLEKQGNKPQGKSALEADEEKANNANKVEPKFHEGDWVVTSYGKVNQVIAVDKDGDGYTLDDDTYFSGSWCDMYHLWTIKDAKDGDILASIYNKPFIYNGNHNSRHVGAYCGITTNDKLIIASEECHWTENLNIHPANKDQRDILMNAMNDDGYVFDFDKKELKKMIYLSAKHNSQPIKPTDE